MNDNKNSLDNKKDNLLENKKEIVDVKLIGLDCAHCASVIEEKVSKMETIESLSLNFINKEMKIIFVEGYNKEKELKKIANIIDNIEPGIKIKEKENSRETIDEVDNSNIKLIRIVLGAVCFLGANFTHMFIIYLISYLLLGYDVILKAFKNVLRGKIFDENFLMSIATIGAFIIKEYPEAVAVMLFYQIGEYFQEKAVGRSRKAIKSLVNIRAEYATRENGERTNPEDIKLGDIIIVKPGEKIPLDGIVIEGSSFLDMSALIGESVPRNVEIGDEILSGSINNNSVIKVKVTKEYANSTVAKILDLVENSTTKKSRAESFISRFAKIYTPIVVFMALFLAIVPPIFSDFNFVPWIKKSLVFLVSSCPCALVISVPLSFFSGIGTASKRGILIKGSMYMQNLSRVDTIVFDKTGTLTKGVFEISKIVNFNISEKELLKIAYSLEKFSIHPVAKSITSYFENNIDKIEDIEVKNFEEISGFGLKGEIGDKRILVGNYKLLEKENISFEKSNENGTIVYIAEDDKYLGYIVVSDIIKDEAKDTISDIKSIGVKSTIMLSGDRKEVANFVAKEIGIDKVYSELLPQDKVSNFEKISIVDNNGKVAFVGDGINDAPVLAVADVGFAMGGVGSDVAIEAADIVIMNDNLERVYESIVISKNTIKVVKSNIIFSLIVKFSVLTLAVFGYATMWIAVFADVGVTFIAILNSMRKKI